jgi:hypothetical protein
MPLEAAGEKDDGFTVIPSAGPGLKNPAVHVVDEDAAFALSAGAGGVFFPP